jgi:uncharacterized protein YkwD
MKIKQAIFLIFIFMSSLLAVNAQAKTKKKTPNKNSKHSTTQNVSVHSKTTPPRVKGKYEDVLLKEGDISKILNDVKNDKYLQFERLSSYLFHQLINQHRIKNNLSWLYWDDCLWLAARNHNVYMANNNFSHDEVDTLKFFSGIEALERVNYVCSNIICSGENIFRSTWRSVTDVEQGAKIITIDAFNSWRKSYGHNQTMLFDKSRTHGTSFYFSDGYVNATTVFAYSSNSNKREITIHWDTKLAMNNIPALILQGDKIMSSIPNNVLNDSVMMIVKAMMPSEKSKLDADMKLATRKHVLYLKSSSENTLIQSRKNKNYYAKTSLNRYLKASKYKKIFKFFSIQIHEKSFIISITLSDFIDKIVFSKIENTITGNLPDKDKVSKWNSSVAFYEIKGTYFCIIDIMWVED